MPPHPLSRIIDQLKREPSRTGSIVITVFGDAIVPRGGVVWLGTLLAFFERLDIESGVVRTAMSRLAADPAFAKVDLAAANIGISWLPNDLWSQGKCGLKVLQYMAAGLPVVANPVGVQAGFVQPGVTGFWANSPDEWVAAVGRLVCDANLRHRLGLAGRRLVEQEYHVQRGAELWLDVLRGFEASTLRFRKSA